MAEYSSSVGFSGMSEGRGQYCCVPECGSAWYKFGNKTHIALFKFPSKDKEPQKYQSWVEEEVLETSETHQAKIQLYVNTILRKNI